MTTLEPFSTAIANIFQVLGDDGWLTKPSNVPSIPVKVIKTTPDRNDLVGQAAMSLANRYLDLPATAGAATGDLVTAGGETFILARSPDPDPLGLAHRWIGVPFMVPVYDVDGHPLVAWNGFEWVTLS
jgi:hypothetical protein